MLYWTLKHLTLGPLLRVVYNPWSVGLENIPAKGAAILASNHLSVADHLFLLLEVERDDVAFLAKKEYFIGKGLQGAFSKMVMKVSNQIPMDRGGGQGSIDSLRAGINHLASGGLLGIYPEGTRSPDGKLYRGRTGVARLALEANVPIIPVSMVDTDKAMPIGTRIPKRYKTGVIVGKPLDFSKYIGLETDRYVLRSITDEVMYEIYKLGSQEYVDRYASSVKAELLKQEQAQQS